LEGRDFLRHDLDETLDAPLRRVIHAEVGIGDLPTFRGHLQDAATALRPQMRQGGADDLDRADQVGLDLLPDLCCDARARSPWSRPAPSQQGRTRTWSRAG
jgi:hypothetical protein